MGEKFGPTLRTIREGARVTMSQLARELGVSVPYLSDVERSHRGPLSPDRLRRACAFLKLTPTAASTLEDAAAKYRGYFELAAASLSPEKRELGAALARRWETVSEDQARKLREVLESDE